IYSLLALTTHPPVQKFSGDAAVALRSSRPPCRAPDSVHGKPADHVTLCLRKTGKPRSRSRHREDHYTPEKLRMECVGKACRAATDSAACRKNSVSWSWRRDSNPRPSDYKSDAVPTELRQQ